MEQEMAESEVGGESQKAEGEKPLCPHCKAPLQSGQTQYLSNYWQWNNKTKDVEEKNPIQILMEYSAQHAEQNTGNPSTGEHIKISR
jgi:hypothetical protein